MQHKTHKHGIKKYQKWYQQIHKIVNESHHKKTSQNKVTEITKTHPKIITKMITKSDKSHQKIVSQHHVKKRRFVGCRGFSCIHGKRGRWGSPNNKGGTSPTSKIDGVDHPHRSQMAFLSPSAVVFSRSVFSMFFSIDCLADVAPKVEPKSTRNLLKVDVKPYVHIGSVFWAIIWYFCS